MLECVLNGAMSPSLNATKTPGARTWGCIEALLQAVTQDPQRLLMGHVTLG